MAEGRLREELSDIEHTRWAGWQVYLHSKCIKSEDGSLTIPAGYVFHLERLINTPYSKLTEKEKDSDRYEVDKTLASIRELVEGRRKPHAVDMVEHKEYVRDCPYCEQNKAIEDALKELGN